MCLVKHSTVGDCTLYTVQPVPAGSRCQRVQCPRPSVKPAVRGRGGRCGPGSAQPTFCVRPTLALAQWWTARRDSGRPGRGADTSRMLHGTLTVPTQLTASVRSDTNEITAIHDSMILGRMDFTDGSSSFWQVLINILDSSSGKTREKTVEASDSTSAHKPFAIFAHNKCI